MQFAASCYLVGRSSAGWKSGGIHVSLGEPDWEGNDNENNPADGSYNLDFFGIYGIRRR
jgi:hypothetical protein